MGRGGVIGIALLPAMLGLAACAPQQQAPIPVEDAQRICAQLALNDAGRNSSPRVSVGVGVGTGSWRRGFGSVGISTEAPLTRRNPEGSYNDCVMRRAGQAPITPFFEQLGAGRT
ncbi:hypothetical protein [uncultured Paracoccus sp.]|uniref:hypothetical protein n=1 Tax=uncultured Paracoccus sp. TaxID=189685 RepID=UPI0025E92196|nr:hypothetical protein [uncultured Paracoccus sp.]